MKRIATLSLSATLAVSAVLSGAMTVSAENLNYDNLASQAEAIPSDSSQMILFDATGYEFTGVDGLTSTGNGYSTLTTDASSITLDVAVSEGYTKNFGLYAIKSDDGKLSYTNVTKNDDGTFTISDVSTGAVLVQLVNTGTVTDEDETAAGAFSVASLIDPTYAPSYSIVSEDFKLGSVTYLADLSEQEYSFTVDIADGYSDDIDVYVNDKLVSPDESGVYTFANTNQDIVITLDGMGEITSPVVTTTTTESTTTTTTTASTSKATTTKATSAVTTTANTAVSAGGATTAAQNADADVKTGDASSALPVTFAVISLIGAGAFVASKKRNND